MAGVGFDAFSAIGAMFSAQDELRPETLEVIAYHFVIERAVDEVLRLSVPFPDDLGRLGQQASTKCALLRVVWQGNPDARQGICDAIDAFNTVRNRVAHPADPRFNVSMGRLTEAYRRLSSAPEDHPTLADITQDILAALGDTSASEIAATLDAFDVVVNERLPAAFGLDRDR